jgi:hypothetical protein
MFDLHDIPKPVQFHVTRWTQDELARGSYSFVANGSGSDMCNTLAEPEWDGRLCFAGEAYAPFPPCLSLAIIDSDFQRFLVLPLCEFMADAFETHPPSFLVT